MRWWNVKHPARYTQRLAEGRSPAAGRELLTTADRHVERVMLELRLSDGLPVGLQVMAPTMADDRMYRIGAALESVVPQLVPPAL